jgi:hypothetical protein
MYHFYELRNLRYHELMSLSIFPCAFIHLFKYTWMYYNEAYHFHEPLLHIDFGTGCLTYCWILICVPIKIYVYSFTNYSTKRNTMMTIEIWPLSSIFNSSRVRFSTGRFLFHSMLLFKRAAQCETRIDPLIQILISSQNHEKWLKIVELETNVRTHLLEIRTWWTLTGKLIKLIAYYDESKSLSSPHQREWCRRLVILLDHFIHVF